MKEFTFYWENKKKDRHLHIDVPGFKKKEIKVKLADGLLTIHAARNTHSVEKSRNFHSEHSYSSTFTRSVSMPNINPTDFAVVIQDNAVLLKRSKKKQRERDD